MGNKVNNINSFSISIALTTYNGEKYLTEQLDSLAKQTCPPIELVICDDGSTDKTIEIIRYFAKTAQFEVRIYENKKNIGYVDNFFKVSKLCKGDWIAFCDQDDIWLPNKLEMVGSIITGNGNDDLLLISHSSEKVTKNLKFMGQRSPDFKKSEIIKQNQHYGLWVLHGFSCIVRRNLISEFDFSKRPRDFNSGKKQAHDVWVCMLTNALGNMYTIKEPLAYWRRHNTATTLSISDVEVPTLKSKIKNSQNFGSELYNFRAKVAKESSDTMKSLALDHEKNKKIYDSLMNASLLFDGLSENFSSREQLYLTKGFFKKSKYLVKFVFTGIYFGSKFHAFGFKSFLKDLHYVVFLR